MLYVDSNVNVDMTSWSQRIMYAMQYDNMTRYAKVALFEEGVVWNVPDGVDGVFVGSKPDGTYFVYDEIDGEQAVTWSDNVVAVALHEQVLAVAGNVVCEVRFYNSDGKRLTTFPFTIVVQKSAVNDDEVTSSSYFNVLTEQIGEALTVLDSLAPITSSEIDDIIASIS